MASSYFTFNIHFIPVANSLFSDTLTFVLNIIYNVIALLPWMYILIHKKWYKWLNIAIIFLTFVSLKRGAIVALIVMLLVQFMYNKSYSIKKIIVSLLTVALLITAFNFVNSYSDGFLEARFQGENLTSGSGRTLQYELAMNDIAKRDFFTLTVGNGSNYSIGLVGTGIHNEWLEMLSSYGLIGAFLYLALFVNMMMMNKRYSNHRMRFSLVQMLALCVILSMVGTMYFGYISIQIFGFFGLLNSKMFLEDKEYAHSNSYV